MEVVLENLDPYSFDRVLSLSKSLLYKSKQIIYNRDKSLDVENAFWMLTYYIRFITIPCERTIPDNINGYRIWKTPIWTKAKEKLKIMLHAHDTRVKNIWLSVAVAHHDVNMVILTVWRLQAVLLDDSGELSYWLSMYLKQTAIYKRYEHGWMPYYKIYLDNLWSAHREGYVMAFKALAHRYKSSITKLNRIRSARVLTEAEDKFIQKRVLFIQNK